MASGRRYTISGRVQGVFFRDSTRQVADELGIVGSAVNLSDGSVEVLAFGHDHDLDKLEAWLRRGPPLSRVTNVVGEQIEDDPPGAFTTG